MKYKLKNLKESLNVESVANIHFFEFDKNFETKNDSHPFAELVFVSRGEMSVKSESFNGLLKKNQAIIHKPNEAHSLSCHTKSLPTVIIIGFDFNANETLDFAYKPITLSLANINMLAEIVKEGRNVFAPPYDIPTYDMKKKSDIKYGAEQLLKNKLEIFLLELIIENMLEHTKQKSAKQTPIQNISEIIKYIDENFLQKILLDELAFLFHTNRAYLCKEFKRITGKTILRYTNDKKIALAKEYIASTNKNFTEIAYELNFDTIHYFTKFFKRETGKTPKEFRLENNQNIKRGQNND